MISVNVVHFFLVLAVTAMTCYAAKTNFLKCDGKTLSSTINKLTVSDCPAVPCTLKKGTNVSVAVDFTMNNDKMAKTANTSVHGIVAGVSVKYDTDYTDACDTAGLKCPLKPGSENIYTAKLYVKKYYPSIELYVQWELLDEAQNDIFCFKIPVVISS